MPLKAGSKIPRNEKTRAEKNIDAKVWAFEALIRDEQKDFGRTSGKDVEKKNGETVSQTPHGRGRTPEVLHLSLCRSLTAASLSVRKD